VPSMATSEARGGECFDERSGWMVSIVFTPRGGDEKIRQEDRNKKKYKVEKRGQRS
jgi:hypothetical protein